MMAAFLLGWLVCGVLALADRGVGSPAFLLRRASSHPAGLMVGLTAVLALTNLIAGVAGAFVAEMMTGRAPALLLAFALACAAVACLIGRSQTAPVGPWAGLAELALSRPIAAGAFVVFALTAWADDLLPVVGATIGELAVMGLAHWGRVSLPDRAPWRWALAAALAAVALGMAGYALGWV